MSAGDGPLERQLCTLDDVKKYIPGYRANDQTEATLQGLIEALSLDLYDTSGREFTTRGNDDPRQFTIAGYHCRNRRVRIGDLATTTDLLVEILDTDGTTLVQTVDAASYRAWPPAPRDAWKPITALEFPPGAASPAQLAPWRMLQLTGTWGFPSIPRNVREGIAKLAIVRYVSDVDAGGATSLSSALGNEIDVAAMFRSAVESLAPYRPKGHAS